MPRSPSGPHLASSASSRSPALVRVDGSGGSCPRPPRLDASAREGRVVVERLWQLYRHDLSTFRGMLPGSDGSFGPGRLPRYFDEPDRCVHLALLADSPVGFTMVRSPADGPRVLGELFVVRAARRCGVGAAMARAVLDEHPGSWEIAFQEENPGAAAFWRRLAGSLPARAVREERRPVPDRPDLPPDTWLVVER